MLARIFEEAGIATVGLSLIRGQAENVKTPRFLHCEFPLGRPLGKPGDVEFQTDVLHRAFALLERTDVPVLVDHPDVIDDEAEQVATCTLPPRLDPDMHPAVDEALGLRPAYERQLAAAEGRTTLGRVATADTIGDVILKLAPLADGVSLADAGFDTESAIAASQDVRAYHEEAALALSDHVHAARSIETGFFTETETGRMIKAVGAALKGAGDDPVAATCVLPLTQA